MCISLHMPLILEDTDWLTQLHINAYKIKCTNLHPKKGNQISPSLLIVKFLSLVLQFSILFSSSKTNHQKEDQGMTLESNAEAASEKFK